MATVKVLARKWTLAAETATPGTFTPILGIISFTFSNSKNDVETTDFTSDGTVEHLVASRARSIKVDGFFMEDSTSKAREPGQLLVENNAKLIGSGSIKNYKLTTPSGATRTFLASTTIGDIGGGNDDMTSWGFELTVSGAITEA